MQQRSLMKKLSEKVRWGYDYLKTKSPFFSGRGGSFFPEKAFFFMRGKHERRIKEQGQAVRGNTKG